MVSGTQGVEGKLIYISGDTSENQALKINDEYFISHFMAQLNSPSRG